MWNKPESASPIAGAPAERKAQAASTPAQLYRRSQVLGLLIVACLLLAAALLRADMHTLFPPGWWRF